MDQCAHTIVLCINPYELIRKYRCPVCDGIMMCACDESFGKAHLLHQLKEGCELESQQRFLITLGFQSNICNICRGLPEKAYPRGETYGSNSKIRRYYWREIWMETTKKFADWVQQENHKEDVLVLRMKYHDMYEIIERQVIDDIKKLHATNPKYVFRKEETLEQFVKKNDVEMINIDGTYLSQNQGRALLVYEGRTYSSEEFGALHFQQRGYQVLFTESRPFHVLFGIFLWLFVQDPKDPLYRIIRFEDRNVFEREGKQKIIWTPLPEDFGTPTYAQRRAEAIDEHFENMIPHVIDDLHIVFEYWTTYSENFRQYLWAHQIEDVEKARAILTILSAEEIRRILYYLISNYWKRFLGWPDLLVHKDNEYFFVEVKSSKDGLRDNQRNWIRSNHDELHLPFKLMKIHRKQVVEKV